MSLTGGSVGYVLTWETITSRLEAIATSGALKPKGSRRTNKEMLGVHIGGDHLW